MKKKIIIMLIFCVISVTNVYASQVSFDITKNGSKYVVEVLLDGEKISYDKAVSEHSLDKYLELYYDGENRYFYMGEEVSFDEYNASKGAAEADKLAKEDKNYIRVKNTEEFIDAVKNIYKDKKFGEYKLVYSEAEYNKFDIDKINTYYKDNILTDVNKNTFKFEEYGLVYPVRFAPTIGVTETIVLYNQLMITDDEYKQVEKFMEYFETLFKGKSDYDKILGVYNYIRDNTKYQEDNGYEFYADGLLSPYDIIFKKKMVCIGAATTFQYMMERLGVESYIVDKVEEIDIENKIYATSHTYNIVQLEKKWYIIDLSVDGDAFLTANNKYKLDTNSIKLDFAKEDYKSDSKKTIKLDYKKIQKKIDEIDGKKQGKLSSIGPIVIVITIALAIAIIVIFMMKQKKMH